MIVTGSGRSVADDNARAAIDNRYPPWALPTTSQPASTLPDHRPGRSGSGTTAVAAENEGNIIGRHAITPAPIVSNALDSSLFSTSASSSFGSGLTASSVVVVGNPQPGSRTRSAAELVARQLAALTSAPDDVLVIELATVGTQLLEWSNQNVAQLKSIVLGAQSLVVSSPTYKASYTGLLKLFVDQFDRDELAGLTTVAVMTGASAAHSLVVETQLKPVLVEIGASLPTRGVYLYGPALDDPTAAVAEWYQSARRPLERIMWR